jgi:transcriptional regulator with XRE-family HTH domain
MGGFMPKRRPAPLGATLRFLRFAGGWSEAELAHALGVSPDLISKYEKGRKVLSRPRLEELLAAVDLPPEAVDACIYALEVAYPKEQPGSPVDPSPAARRSIHRAAAIAGQQAAEATLEKLEENVRRLGAAQVRRQAGELWEGLVRLPSKQRRAVVEAEPKYWTWAVSERLCAESVRAAAHRADEAAELAKLALRVAELAPGSEPWRSRIQGYVWAFIANARRVQGDLPGAEEAFLHSDRLWEAGAPADPGVLDGSRPLDLKGSLRQYQGRFEEALELLERAQKATRSVEAVGRILIQKASTLRLMGDFQGSLSELRQANALVAGSQDARLSWLVQYLLAANLGDMGCHTEAEALLPVVRGLAVELGNELDVIRVLWLEGRVIAGLKRREEALPALEQVRRYFTTKQIAYDAALASLEVAVLYLEAGRTGEVKRLAEEMLWIFKTQGVRQETLAALKLFYDTAKREEATVGLAREILDYLNKARHNPKIRFHR